MNRFEKVKACLKMLGYTSLSSENFEDKLVIQKIVYLIQLKGMRTGYAFNLYVRGPYSPDLTSDIYEHSEELEHLDSHDGLSDVEQRYVEEFKKTIELKPSQLEVAATYSYFAFELGNDAISSTAKVREMKGFYPEAQIALGISRAKQLFFKPTKQELDSLKAEATLWENASETDVKD
ncbi:MAG: hypothetical protein ABR986_05440 [Methanomassiliicoccales archaeon]|jgi:uncharacterized protein YwgA